MRAPVSTPLLAGLAALLALCACGRSQDSTPAQPPPPADAAPATDFSRPLNALGNEPFWAVKIRPEGIVFSAPDMADVTAPNQGPAAEPDRAVWTGAGSDGATLAVTLTAKVCQDTMSGANYPFTASVQAAGRTWTGCAAYADAMPRPE